MLVVLTLLAGGLMTTAQTPGDGPPRPAPPNKPELPGAPPTVFDDIGYCIVGGPVSQYCSKFDLSCVPLPTSLLVPVIPEEQDTVGWSSSPNASECGTKSCFLVLRCACGATLLNQVCGD
jgi:hypothetical protein